MRWTPKEIGKTSPLLLTLKIGTPKTWEAATDIKLIIYNAKRLEIGTGLTVLGSQGLSSVHCLNSDPGACFLCVKPGPIHIPQLISDSSGKEKDYIYLRLPIFSRYNV